MEKFETAEFEAALPRVLREDVTCGILANTGGEALRNVNAEMAKSIVWARIDELDEETLDLLAIDLHVDWWRYAADIDAKRENLKAAVEIHRIMGTKEACELAAQMCVGGGVRVKEWYEYGGKPGYFKLLIDETETVNYDDLIAIIFKVKRCSSWLESFVQTREAEIHANVAVFMQSAVDVELWPKDTSIPVIEAALSLTAASEIFFAAAMEDDAGEATVVYADSL